MKGMKPSVKYFRIAAGGLIIAASIYLVSAADTNAPPPSASNSARASSNKPAGDGSLPKKLTGVELYAVHCNRCHPERYPTEFKEDEWRTIMMHMRVRANLSADDARVIMQYLREEGGN